MPETQSGKRYVRRGDGLPEVGWQNESRGYVISELELCRVLGTMAIMFHLGQCTQDWCEQCNPMRKVWWDLYNGCDREARLAVAQALSDTGVPLPPGYYDETPLP